MRTCARTTAFLLVMLVVLAACGDNAKPTAPTTAAPQTTSTVARFGTASGPRILDVRYRAEGSVPIDFAMLDALATKTYAIFEPFDKKVQRFHAVELWTVLQAAGVPETATKVQMTALDDYKVELDVAVVKAGGVLVATRLAGEPIPVERGGPARIVFEPHVQVGKNTDRWIWSLVHIVVP